jgi:hypothetical protein
MEHPNDLTFREIAKGLVIHLYGDDYIPLEKEEQIYMYLLRHFENDILSRWNIEDVLHAAEDQEESLTDDEAREILYTALHKLNANIGISWDVIKVYIDEYLEENRPLKQPDFPQEFV